MFEKSSAKAINQLSVQTTELNGECPGCVRPDCSPCTSRGVPQGSEQGHGGGEAQGEGGRGGRGREASRGEEVRRSQYLFSAAQVHTRIPCSFHGLSRGSLMRRSYVQLDLTRNTLILKHTLEHYPSLSLSISLLSVSSWKRSIKKRRRE